MNDTNRLRFPNRKAEGWIGLLSMHNEWKDWEEMTVGPPLAGDQH